MTAATTATVLSTPPSPTLEELVDRLIDALFGLDSTGAAPVRTSPARAIHEARRLRQTVELAGALAVFSELDLTGATEGEARWAHAEFLDLARRCFGGDDTRLYRPGNGRAAVLAPLDDDETLEVRAVLGMRWRPGKLVSRRSLRGLTPLRNGGPG